MHKDAKPTYILVRDNMRALIRYMIDHLGMPEAAVRLQFEQALEDVVDPPKQKVEA